MAEPTSNEEENKRYDTRVNISLLNESAERINAECIQTNDAKNLISEYQVEIDRLRKHLAEIDRLKKSRI